MSAKKIYRCGICDYTYPDGTKIFHSCDEVNKKSLRLEELRAKKLHVDDFIALIKKTNGNKQIRAIVDCLDNCYQADNDIMAEDDWPKISKVVSENMW